MARVVSLSLRILMVQENTTTENQLEWSCKGIAKERCRLQKEFPLENFFIWAMALILGMGLSQDKGHGQRLGRGESHD